MSNFIKWMNFIVFKLYLKQVIFKNSFIVSLVRFRKGKKQYVHFQLIKITTILINNFLVIFEPSL